MNRFRAIQLPCPDAVKRTEVRESEGTTRSVRGSEGKVRGREAEGKGKGRGKPDQSG